MGCHNAPYSRPYTSRLPTAAFTTPLGDRVSCSSGGTSTASRISARSWRALSGIDAACTLPSGLTTQTNEPYPWIQ